MVCENSIRLNNMVDVWDATGTYKEAIKIDVTDTASSGTSRLLNLLRDGVEKFGIDKNGNIFQQTTSTSSPATGEYPNSGSWGLHRDSSSDIIYIAYNNGTGIDSISDGLDVSNEGVLLSSSVTGFNFVGDTLNSTSVGNTAIVSGVEKNFSTDNLTFITNHTHDLADNLLIISNSGPTFNSGSIVLRPGNAAGDNPTILAETITGSGHVYLQSNVANTVSLELSGINMLSDKFTLQNSVSGLDVQGYRALSTQLAGGTHSTAVGVSNTASATESSAFGFSNKALKIGALAIGWTNYSNGTYSAAIGNANTTVGANSSAIGVGNLASTGVDSSAIGRSNIASGTYSSAIGCTNDAGGVNSSAFGFTNTAGGTDSSAVGASNTAAGHYSSAIGSANSATGTSSSAIGKTNTAGGSNSSAVGSLNTASADTSSAFGRLNTAAGDNSSVLGFQVKTTEDNTSEVGYWSSTSVRDSSVRMHPGGMIASTVEDVTGYLDGGATVGSEASGTLPREMYTIRRNGLEFFLQFNDGGTIKQLSLGTATGV